MSNSHPLRTAAPPMCPQQTLELNQVVGPRQDTGEWRVSQQRSGSKAAMFERFIRAKGTFVIKRKTEIPFRREPRVRHSPSVLEAPSWRLAASRR